MEPDRAWLLTPTGAGAIAVIRVRGTGVSGFLQSRFSEPCGVMRCVHGELCDEAGHVVDDPVIVLLDEITADINLHGGGAVIRAALGLLDRQRFIIGATERDPTVGFDLITQEMHAALRLPRTKAGLALLLAQPRMWAGTTWTRESVTAALADRSLDLLLHPPTIAIIGIANVGKSTLANQLFGQTRSIVLDEPGTTRDYVSDLADLDGLAVHLIDTPGRRATDDPIEAAAIALSDSVIAAADLRLLVLDPTQAAEPQQRPIAQFPDAVLVANKSDAAAIWQPPTELKIAAKTRTGIDKLVSAVHDQLGLRFSPARPLLWTTRQHDFLHTTTSD